MALAYKYLTLQHKKEACAMTLQNFTIGKLNEANVFADLIGGDF
jgi:hypothetical protein